ncbi:hypothetical protein lerEdw1_009624 [Lerista edwardsae]|nr:hypothetical protein lerEdw1_009624 [Lerista edwardsae]
MPCLRCAPLRSSPPLLSSQPDEGPGQPPARLGKSLPCAREAGEGGRARPLRRDFARLRPAADAPHRARTRLSPPRREPSSRRRAQRSRLPFKALDGPIPPRAGAPPLTSAGSPPPRPGVDLPGRKRRCAWRSHVEGRGAVMAAPEGERRSARFECPADFCPCPFSPAPAFSRETLQSPSKQLWLIRAPANFSPESLDGHAVPLLGSETLKVAQPDGTRKVYSIQATLGDLDSAHLLVPAGHQHHLACAPSFSGVLSVCERHGDPSANRLLFPVAARLAPQIPDGLRQRFLPFGGLPSSRAAEELPRKRRKKKRRELHTVGYLDAPEEPLPPEHKPWPGGASVGPAGEAGGSRQGERGRRHKQGEALPPALGAAPQLLPEQGSHLEDSAQGSLCSGAATDPGLRSRKKRKRQQLLKEEAQELPLEPSALPQQPAPEEPCFRESPQADGAAEGSGPGAEGLAHCRPRKKKKKRRREEEEEARATVASVDAASARQEAESGQWDSAGLAEGRHKKRKKEKVVLEEQPLLWEQGAEAEVLGPSPVLQDAGGWAEQGPGLPSEEGTGQKHKKKKKKKHKREAAEEEGLAS